MEGFRKHTDPQWKAWLSLVLFDMCKLWHQREIQASICRTYWHAMWSADLLWLYSLPTVHLPSHLQHSKVTVLHPFSHICSHDPSSSASVTCVIDAKTFSTPSVVEDKGGFLSSLSRWMGMNSTVLLPRTILCAVTYTHIHQWILVSHTHTHTHILVSVYLAG